MALFPEQWGEVNLGSTWGGVLAPRPGIEPTPPALKSRVLITGLPGKS